MTQISENNISLRKLKSEDSKLIFQWRNDETIIRLSSSQKKVSWQEHQEWIKNSIQSPIRTVFIIENNEEPVGQVRFDKENKDNEFAIVSIYLLPKDTKKGIGTRALQLACQQYFQEEDSVKEIFAFVRDENTISQKFFLKCGFEKNNQKVIAQHQTFKLIRSPMNISNLKQDLEKNIDFYSNLIEKYGIDVKSLNWGSKQSQELRFKVLSQIGDMTNKSVLDVGCGLGDFYEYLTNNHIKCEYKGIDITPKMVEMAKKRFPSIDFEVKNILEESSDQEYDYIFASGIFYLVEYEPFIFMQKMVTKMFELARIGVAFNSLSTWASRKENSEFYANPAEVLDFCKSLSKKVVINHSYHQADFTVFLYK